MVFLESKLYTETYAICDYRKNIQEIFSFETKYTYINMYGSAWIKAMHCHVEKFSLSEYIVLIIIFLVKKCLYFFFEKIYTIWHCVSIMRTKTVMAEHRKYADRISVYILYSTWNVMPMLPLIIKHLTTYIPTKFYSTN